MTLGITPQSLDHLPAPQMIEELDAEAIVLKAKSKLVELYADIADLLQLESEPAVKQIEVAAYRETLVRERINEAFRAGLLYYANGNDLDHLAAFYDLLRMASEDDARLRTRITLAIQGRSTGGTEERYRLIAMSADIRVADAKPYVIGKSPLVHVAVFSTDDDGIADQTLLDTVSQSLKMPNKRMISDHLNIVSAVTQTVDIQANVWLLPNAASSVFDSLENTLRAAHAQENGLGFDLTRAWITSRLMPAGVQRVEIVSPSNDIIVQPMTAVTLGAINLNFMGNDY